MTQTATGKNTSEKEWPTYRALDRQVLAVAVKGAVGDWAAYIGAVPGENHNEEALEVARHGSKLAPMIAKILFPSMARFKWRE